MVTSNNILSILYLTHRLTKNGDFAQELFIHLSLSQCAAL